MLFKRLRMSSWVADSSSTLLCSSASRKNRVTPINRSRNINPSLALIALAPRVPSVPVPDKMMAAAASSLNILELIHELKIYQAELEIQNEELKRAQHEISELHQEYEDLYKH